MTTDAYDMTGPQWHQAPAAAEVMRLRDIPCQRPWRETPIDPDALATWTANNERARVAYRWRREYQDYLRKATT